MNPQNNLTINCPNNSPVSSESMKSAHGLPVYNLEDLSEMVIKLQGYVMTDRQNAETEIGKLLTRITNTESEIEYLDNIRRTELERLCTRITNVESESELLYKELISSLKKIKKAKFIKETGESMDKLTTRLKISSYILFGTAIIHGIWCLSTIIKGARK